ncbi:hypothetical protein N7509_007236 [Penicillium cosmopolitanum]|uniref:STAS domain-containing protein n=1 Tax=Penicillium cosmopolitanum TaxID=1131564 RepID=A0A9X0B884_9EURO|nr:uncharacterized protein N7509_007236 [Penicillium cosmopolitanum]KAJ5391746.1 hypothetical protein N7509_007236 [Penicillium cosmopolitanum]
MLGSQTRDLREAARNDDNLNRFLSLTKVYLPRLPKASAEYLVAKVPVVQWSSKYSFSWLWSDLVAGITIGILLVPQSLAYAKVANIPARYGLLSSWLPTLIYAIMGTSKDVTAGPTAIMGLLTGEIVTDLVKTGYAAESVATAVAFWVGIYSLILGLFRLGFLLEFIPLPVLSGYVSGAAITIVLQQLKGLFGEAKSANDTAGVIRVFFQRLPNTNWRAFLMGFSSIILLLLLQFVGRKWGKKHRILWYLSIARNALVLVIFTAISWGVNKSHKSEPLFGISEVSGTGIIPPSVPDTQLLVKTAGRSIAPFLAAALEHLAIGKAFGRRHGYVIEQDQELSYIGVANLVGSFFSSMPVTGGFSRTAVNSESGVKSPLSGLATTACVLVSIYKLTDAFYWIPSATLSAIIIIAVWQIILPFQVFWQYWKTSFADFVGSMIAFWVTLFVDVEIGIACAVGYSIVYVLFQLAFAQVDMVTSENYSQLYPASTYSALPAQLPEDTVVFALRDSVLYPNAARIARQFTEYIYSYTSGVHETPSGTTEDYQIAEKSTNRLWNDTKARRIEELRKKAGTTNNEESFLPHVRTVIIDMTRVTHIDTSGMQALADTRSMLKEWAGADAELAFVGLNERVRERFQRAEKSFVSSKSDSGPRDQGYIVFDVLQTALYNTHASEESTSTDVAKNDSSPGSD